jgi:hypothetical protein
MRQASSSLSISLNLIKPDELFVVSDNESKARLGIESQTGEGFCILGRSLEAAVAPLFDICNPGQRILCRIFSYIER